MLCLQTNFSGTSASQTMTDGAHVLAHNLYVDPTHLTIWGDGTSGTATVSGTWTGAQRMHPCLRKDPAGQNAAVRAYADLITVTVTF